MDIATEKWNENIHGMMNPAVNSNEGKQIILKLQSGFLIFTDWRGKLKCTTDQYIFVFW